MVRLSFPPKLHFLFEPHRYKIAHGGRGSAKSWSFARALLLQGIAPSIGGRPWDSLRVLCARETQKSIADSVHKLLCDQIVEMGIGSDYEVQQNSILGRRNHTEFIFAGLRHNINNIKSVESCDIAWVEEAHTVSKQSWDILIPSIRKDQSEIWATFNPELDTDDTYKRFVLTPPRSAHVVRVNWQDNPWFPQVLQEEMEEMRERDHDNYLHIYEGECTSSVSGAIYKAEIARATKEGRICRVSYDATKPVQTFWDLGFDDCTSIIMAQPVAGMYNVIDCLEDSGKTIEWYLRQLQKREYVFGTFWLPWDGLKQYKKLGSGKSTEEILRAAGCNVRFVTMLEVHEGINALRTMFPQIQFDAERCADLLQSLRHYQWGPLKEGQRKREPLHNWASHFSDSARYMATAIKTPQIEAEKRKQTVVLPPPMPGPFAPFG